ncbi:hypothetical protein O181_008023 [Austropuccinia psidii MF-1]|uniref:Tf2-1-like SH3-like domain-containing protein n=1 Tax=Austropuccinia psidii MF-1 TaxID=1389203 RepID=A0A9Q3GI52_9BASI|nr:hypothetical protein [Austropuccinia psidii MF-1]
MVWLSSKNIKPTRPTKKLSERWLGPFPILKKVSTNAYHLKLPSQWRYIHPSFHISLLETFLLKLNSSNPKPIVNRRPNNPHIICQPVINYQFLFSRFKTSGIATSNISQQPQMGFTLSWCSGAHHSRWGYSQNHRKDPTQLVFYGKSILRQYMANWPLMEF